MTRPIPLFLFYILDNQVRLPRPETQMIKQTRCSALAREQGYLIFFARILTAASLIAAIAGWAWGRQQEPAQEPKPSEPAQTQQQNPQSPPANPTAPASPPAQATQPQTQSPASQTTPLALNDAVSLALNQVSNFQQAQLNELSAAEDVRQARLAFLPQITAPLSFTYNSPATGPHLQGVPRSPSFISADAITAYEALAGVAGDIDLSGRLRATLRRNQALLEAARAGTEVARRELISAVNETYYGLALAAARRRSAELTLAAAEEFEHVTGLLAEGGEVAQVDLTRARLQTITRRDELEQARAEEIVAADSLRVFVGYDLARPIAATDLEIAPPDPAELDRFTTATIAQRPELKQFEAERRAAEQEKKAAHAERLPQVSYSIYGGFNTDSLNPDPLKEHSGVLATINVTIPIFDWGLTKSRERQADLRAKSLKSQSDLALRNFTQQFYSARAQALSAAARVSVLRNGITEAEQNLQTSISRYRAGEAQIIEVTDAQTTLAAQRAALFQALFDYQIARARLRQAAGQ